jgi:hypothetical protein
MFILKLIMTTDPVPVVQYTMPRNRNIFNYGRMYNHSWIPLPYRNSKDMNLIDNIGEWARNKTVLLIGDSLDRQTVQWICLYKNWTLTKGLYPSADGWVDCKKYNGCSNVCTSEEFNFTIVNAFMVGLNPHEFLRPVTGHHLPNYQTMDPKRRLKEVYLPFLRDFLKRSPQMVVFYSGYLFS